VKIDNNNHKLENLLDQKGRELCLRQAFKYVFILVSCDLELWPPEPQSRLFHDLPHRPLVLKISSFVFKILCSQVW